MGRFAVAVRIRFVPPLVYTQQPERAMPESQIAHQRRQGNHLRLRRMGLFGQSGFRPRRDVRHARVVDWHV